MRQFEMHPWALFFLILTSVLLKNYGFTQEYWTQNNYLELNNYLSITLGSFRNMTFQSDDFSYLNLAGKGIVSFQKIIGPLLFGFFIVSVSKRLK